MTSSTAITLDSPKTDSLIMVDKHLDTILETESDEFIKSSVENIVQNPSEFEDFSEDECECDVPDCDDSQTTKFSTFSNPLIADSTSSDDESFFDDDFDSLLEQFSDELAHIDPIPPRIEEADFDLKEEIRLVENLSDSQMEEIDLFLASDDSMPPGIKNDDYGSEGDIRFLEELLSNNPLPLLKIESSNLNHFNNPSSPHPPLEPPNVENMLLHESPNTTGWRERFLEELEAKMNFLPIGGDCPGFLKPLVLVVLSFDHKSFKSSASFGKSNILI
ncbi:hypothetical protein Tco_0281546 [Tanacetum coccineum]